MPRIDDDSLADAPTEVEHEESLIEETPEPADDESVDSDDSPEVEEVKPEDFDLLEWLSGIGPAIASYPLATGGRIPLRARTSDWLDQWRKDSEDMDADERDRIFVAAHIADERVTPDSLKPLQQHSPIDWSEIVGVAIHLDTRPTNLLAPRFLPAASD